MTTLDKELRRRLEQSLLLIRKQQARIAELELKQPIAVIGMAGRFPGAASIDAFWRLLEAGVDAISEVPPDRWDADAYYHPDPNQPGKICTRYGGFLEDIDQFDPQFFGISPREAITLDPQQRLLLELSWEALECAGIDAYRLHGSRTGVFIGISDIDYAQLVLEDTVNVEPHAAMGNGQAFAAGRISYVLGLQGPCQSIDTLCSSSLVAVHQSCRSLSSGESDLALAGGVHIMLSPSTSMLLSRAHALAPDGRCKTFDAAADGFSRGEGGAIVVLKRLADAQRDNDPIHAVIRGSAVNQDGRSSGLTAPNGPAQERVIRDALRHAGIRASDVAYLEAHGTGTSLGDPIEIQAAAAALGTGRNGLNPLLVGSVKTNIGHLEAAAGLAGLIKAILAIQHARIPRHLHLTTPSPQIPWERLPVRLTGELMPWPDRKKIAGVSSFGMSGTNAHVIVEEAPPAEALAAASMERSHIERSHHVLPLSGRTRGAFEAQVTRYRDWLAAHGEADIADVTFTAGAGRSHHEERAAMVVESSARAVQLLDQLARGESAPGLYRKASRVRPKVAWLFTGQGSQYAGMGRELYDSQPVVRRVLDQCAAWFAAEPRAERGEALLEVMFSKAALLNRTEYTQPALYALEVALAELWRSWGVEPDVVLGHSVGQYAAAVIAGVMSVEDGLRLIARRGAWMGSLPAGGAMAAVFAERGWVEQGLWGSLTLAADNGAHVVVSGTASELDRLLGKWEAAGVRSQRLNTSHAFHSELLEPMLDELEGEAAKIRFQAAERVLVCNLTGKALAAGQVLDAGYWRRHAREPVEYARSIRTLAERGVGVLLEIGPQPVLLGMAGQCWPAEGAKPAMVASLKRGQREQRAAAEAIAQMYVEGVTPDFAAWDQPWARRKLALPTYPFQRSRYWIEAPRRSSAAVPEDCYYQTAWQAAPVTPGGNATGTWLLIADQQGYAGQLAVLLEARGIEARLVHSVDDLEAIGMAPRRIVQMRGLDLPGRVDAEALHRLSKDVLADAAQWVQTLSSRHWPVPMDLITRGAQAVDAGDVVNPLQAAIWGFGRTLALEMPELWGGVVDVPEDVTAFLEPLVEGLLAADREDQTAVRSSGRWAARLRRVPGEGANQIAIRGDAAYLITGGWGALGLLAAEWLAGQGARCLVLVGRSEPPADARGAIERLRQQFDCRVETWSADVSRAEEVHRLLKRMREQLPGLRGVVHAAGLLDDGVLLQQNESRFQAVMEAKAGGAWNLHEETLCEPLDFFVLYSSAASVLGSAGQANYAAANAFLDGLAWYRRAQGLPATALNWGPWESGMGGRAEARRRWQSWGVSTISGARGKRAWENWVNGGLAQVMIQPVVWESFARNMPERAAAGFLSELAPAEQAGSGFERRLAATPPERLRALFEELAREAIGEVLGLEAHSIDATAGVFDLGMDSLMALELRDRLQQHIGGRAVLSSTLAMDYPSVDRLSAYLEQLVAPERAAPRRPREPRAGSSEPIAMIGLACRFPGAGDVEKFWDLLARGGDAITTVPAERWDMEAYYDADPMAPGKMVTRYGGFVADIDQFDAGFFGIAPREAISMDPQHRMLLEVSWEALERAGQAPGRLMGSRTGVFVGISGNDYATLVASQGAEELDAYFAIGSALSAAAGRLSHTLGLQGPALSIDTACSSSLVAVHEACRSLASGECELALAGGVNAVLNPLANVGLSKARMLAPDGRCKTFDAAADGYVRGDGCGMVVLKRLSEAERDGDRILGVIRGTAVNQDGRSGGLTVPNGPAQERLIGEALAQAGVEPGEVVYLEAHGTGTSLGDPIEAQAASAALGVGRERPLLIGSVKTNVGHLEAAAGIAGLAKVVLSMEHGIIPRHLHFTRPNPHIRWEQAGIEVTAEARAWPEGRRKIAGVSSFGFIGTNTHVVIEEAPERAEVLPGARERNWHVLAISARNEAALMALAERYAGWLESHPEAEFADVAYTAGVGRNHFQEQRAAVVAETGEQARELLSSLVRGEETAGLYRGQARSQDEAAEREQPTALDQTVEQQRAAAEAIAQMYVEGVTPDFAAWDQPWARRKLALPTYPFQRSRYWIEAPRRSSAAVPEDCYYQTVWQAAPVTPGGNATGTWLLIADQQGYAGQLAVLLEARGIEARLVHSVDDLEAIGMAPRRIVQMRGLDLPGRVDAEALHRLSKDVLADAAQWVQTLSSRHWPVPMDLITRGAQAVDAGDVVNPLQAAIWGFGRTLALEMPELWGGVVDVPEDVTAFLEPLVEGLLAADREDQTAVRSSGRWAARLRRVPGEGANQIAVRGDAAYLITGGWGALGLLAAEWLAGQGARCLVLVGRSEPPADARGAIERLRQQFDCRVETWSADVSRAEEVHRLLKRMREQLPGLRGVVHAAGLLDDGVLLQQNESRFQAVMEAKAGGAWNLHEETLCEPLDFFVLYSSAASVLGSAGQANYAAANAFLDGLAWYRRAQGLPATALNWGPWESGMGGRAEARRRWQSWGVSTISGARGKRAWENWVNGGLAQVMIQPVVWESFVRNMPERASAGFLSELAPAEQAGSGFERRLAATPPERLRALFEELAREAIGEVLGLEAHSIDATAGVFDLGMDSLMALELRDRLQQHIGGRAVLSSTLAMDYPSVDRLSAYLEQLVAPERAAPRRPREPRAGSSEPIAMIGLACRFPGAGDVEKFWDLLARGGDAITTVPAERWDMEAYYDADPMAPGKMVTRYGGFVTDIDQFDAGFFGIAPREAISMDPQHRMLLEVSWEALERAGQAPGRLMGSRTGVFVGISGNDYATLVASQGAEQLDAYFAIGSALSAAAGRLSHTLGLQGPALSIDTACSSSLVAVHEACRSLASGECELALAGGVNAVLNPLANVGLSKARMLAPDGRCKTFDAAADGYVRGDGCGMVVLKRLSEAERDGDRILGVIRGTAVNQDGRSGGLTVPNGPAQERLIGEALAQAGVEPGEVVYLEAHGTGTSLGDPIEVQAASAALGVGRERPLLIGSVKTNVGHLEAAAGIAGLAKVVLSMEHGIIPRHLHFTRPNPHIRWEQAGIEVTAEARAWPEGKRKIAGVSSFGFIGTNTHVVIEEAPERAEALPGARERNWHVLAISARNEAALMVLAERYAGWLESHPEAEFADVAYTAGVGRNHFQEQRAAVVAETGEQARELLNSLVRGEETAGLYRGQARSQDEAAEREQPTALDQTVEQQRAAAEALAQMYVEGVTPDFAAWDRPWARRKLALPTYPFQRTRYWFQPRDIRPSADFLGTRLELASGDAIFSSEISTQRQAWISDHRLYDSVVVPGAMYAAMALAATGVPACLTNVLFHEPMLLPEGHTRELQFRILPADEHEAQRFEAHSRPAGKESRGSWILHASGTVDAAPCEPASSSLSISSLQSRLRLGAAGEMFSALKGLGLELGPSFRAVESIWRGPQEALARLVVPSTLSHYSEAPIHPVVLDACTHVAAAALSDGGALHVDAFYAPFEYEALVVHEPVPSVFFIHAVLRSSPEESDETRHFDLSFLDDSGTVIGVLRGFAVKRAPRSAFLKGGAGELSSLLYEVAWKEQEREGEWPSPESVARQVREEAAGLIAEAGLEEETAGRLDEEMEAVSRAYAREALERVAPENVAAAQRRLYRRLGQIASKGMEPASEGLQRLKERYPQARLEATLLERCGRRLAQVLRGECDPLGLLFPTQGVSAEQVYRDAPGARLLNRMVERTLAAVVAQAGEQRKIRVLEVGAGTGATTLAALRSLPRERTEYTYTDISAGFFDAAQRRLEEYPEVRYRVLDIERGVEEQGFERGQYDVVIAAHVLHATRDLGASVRHAWELLAEGGLLIVVEGLRAQSWLDVTFGQLEGWWRFADQWRGEGPLVGVDRWREVLGEAGIGGVEAMVPWGESPQGVLVGRAEGAGNQERGWWLIAGGGEVGERAAERMREKGWECEVAAGRGAEGESAEYWEERLKRGAPSGVAHLCSLDGVGELEEDLRHSGASLLGLVQAMVRREAAPRNGLWVVTEGGQGVEGEGCRSLAQSGVWGMGKVIALEHPELGCRRVDLERGRAREQIAAAVEEWGTAGSEDHIAWRGGRRLVARLQRVEKGSHLAIPEGENYSLRKAENGTLEGLRWEPLTCPAPGKGEVQVEVRAAGLNFRDVLNALGMYPGEGGPLGGEMAGRVVEVGPGVDQYAVGDAVMGLVPGAFAGRVNVRVALLAHKPEQVSFGAAAGVPIAFATAALGLERAGLRAGERILIHAAAGGVGLAAIQLARAVGAEIYATASADKQDYLRGLGIEHIYDSRSVEFGERIRADTGNRGVDVVLNSLTGEGYVEASLGALGRGGRFVEISKREIWSEREMARRRPDVRYEVLALDEEMGREPERIGAVVREVVARMGRGELHALPGEGYGMSEARAAFRRMQQARHVGKLVLMAPGYRGKLDGAAGYLITGGLGGLGLEVARWAVERGARYVALNGRRGPEGRAEAAIEQLRAQGAEVEIVLGDVSREADVEAMLRRVRGHGRRLAGVFHLAGVLRDGALVNQEWGRFEEVLGPKARGAWYLHRHTAGDDPELFVMFSSTASLLGNRGQANHAAANMFLDMLAQYRRSQGMSGVSINWGAWSKVGAAARLEHTMDARLAGAGVDWIAPSQGLNAFESILSRGIANCGVVNVNWNKFARILRDGQIPAFLRDVVARRIAASESSFDSGIRRRLDRAPAAKRPAILERYVAEQVMQVLQLAAVPDPDMGFFHLGMDSLMTVELRNRLNSEIKPVPPLASTALFDYPTIAELAQHLAVLIDPQGGHRDGEVSLSTLELLQSVTNESLEEMEDPAVDQLIDAAFERMQGETRR